MPDPEALVGTEWLAAHLADPNVRVARRSFKQPGITPTAREDYERGHIPGAVFFDIDDVAEPGTSLPHMIPSAERFAAKMAERGIGNDDRVIVYDAIGLSSAGRAWWMLRLFGHDNVALLDGGLPKWKAEGRPLETAAPAIPPRRFTARFRPELVRDKEAVLGNIATAARAGRRCPRRRPLRRHRRGNLAGPAPRPYSRQPQPAVRPGHRSADPPVARAPRLAPPVRRSRRRARTADRHELRLGRHRLRGRLCGAPDRPSRRGRL